LGLAVLGLGSGKEDLVLGALLRVLMVEGGKGTPPGSAARSAIARARSGGADEADVAYLERMLARCDRRAKELAAQEAWKEIAGLLKEKRWKRLLVALRAFRADYAETSFLRNRGEALVAYAGRAETEVERAEGCRFDFKTLENFERFRKVFGNSSFSGIDLVRGKGRAVFRAREKRPKVCLACLQAEALKLGKTWELFYRLDTTIRPKDAGGRAAKTVAFTLRFLRPGARLGGSWRSHNRFQLNLSSSHGGHILCAFRAVGQEVNLGPKGPFVGMKSQGLKTDAYFSGKVHKDPNGRFAVRLRMRGARFSAIMNGVPAVDEALPASAVETISNSPLTLCVYPSGTVKEVYLEEFFFRRGPGLVPDAVEAQQK
jgi:hypothetical protein